MKKGVLRVALSGVLWVALIASFALVGYAQFHTWKEGQIIFAFAALATSFWVLRWSADRLVDGAVGIACALAVPAIVVGIVLVSLTTTAPELVVSVQAALRGQPEYSAGNAIGSVICDDGLALGIMAVAAHAPIAIHPRILRSAGLFLILVDIVALVMGLDGRYTPVEGGVLVGLFALYLVWTMIAELARSRRGEASEAAAAQELEAGGKARPLTVAAGLFAFGVAGVLLSSRIVLDSANVIAVYFAVPKVIIGLTLVAFGTSLPEIATCYAAARKGQGSVAVGNILGADILNVCWILGASALATALHPTNPRGEVVTAIELELHQVYFMFAAMLAIVITMLLCMRIGYRMTRAKGVLLLVMFVAYLAVTAIFFGVPAGPGT